MGAYPPRPARLHSVRGKSYPVVRFFVVDGDRQFTYALTAGAAISGLLFWLTFWHWQILEAIVVGLTIFGWYWLRFRGREEWNHIHRRGTRRQIRQYEATVVLLAVFLVVLCVQGCLRPIAS